MVYRHYFNYCIMLMTGFCVALIALLQILWKFLRHPVNFIYTVRPKDRQEIPSCLKDENLGSHGFIQLQELKLHYVASGDESKPLMLFLHGFPEFWYSWRYQIREFNKDYRVVAIDMRGYGDSDKPSGVQAYKREKLIDDIKQVISALGFRTCVLVGHDWGGMISYHFVAKYPEMIDRMIIMNAPHPATLIEYAEKHPAQKTKSLYVTFFQLPWIPELFVSAFDFEALFKTMADKQNGMEHGKMSESDIDAYKYALSRPGSATAAINYYRAAYRYPRDNCIFNTLETPTLLIWGCQDRFLEKELAALSSKFTTNLTVKYIEEASHWVQLDKPDEVNSVMKDWLSM